MSERRDAAPLQACLNGARSRAEHEAVPISPDEIARDALAVLAAGANALHVHPRDADGLETLEPDDVAACLDAIRAVAPALPIGVGTGDWIAPGGRARLASIDRWTVLPDYASVNLGEPDHADAIGRLLSKGIGVEAGIWNREDAERFAALPTARRCLRILIEMTDDDPEAALEEYSAVMDVLDASDGHPPILLHGENGSVWAMVNEAARRGFGTRVGLEDGPRLPDGSIAPDNAALIAAAARRLQALSDGCPSAQSPAVSCRQCAAVKA